MLVIYCLLTRTRLTASISSTISLGEQLQHGNYNAPIEDSLTNGIKVLDAGCGTGRWTIDMAEDYPASKFFGLDIADMFPKAGYPENCTFIHADTLKKLPFEDNTFDFVFQRLMLLAFTPADWNMAISELVRVTKPGGWIELYEVEMQMQRPGGTFLKFYKGLETAAELNKIDMSLVHHLPELVSSHLENIHYDYLSLPFGWHGPVGQLFLSNWEMCYRALQHVLAPIMGVTDKEYSDMIAQVCVEFPEKKTWTKMPYVFGMKPLPVNK
ncbi:S-adenosyl-L-methionine-dependent methyltransferase [Jimgerdemannia flammicorona]|uniref:S-adenosyl-L-methionine-dependent methyltransferase n=1 Tax=Jimgerdemannia flammicorona TaxID=994334 RepID=A0A433QM58_9FUNG|nr:S-adenosyl-L-methionine-dependent methyltransferase [Jimgerdemannia flammicorona]